MLTTLTFVALVVFFVLCRMAILRKRHLKVHVKSWLFGAVTFEADD